MFVYVFGWGLFEKSPHTPKNFLENGFRACASICFYKNLIPPNRAPTPSLGSFCFLCRNVRQTAIHNLGRGMAVYVLQKKQKRANRLGVRARPVGDKARMTREINKEHRKRATSSARGDYIFDRKLGPGLPDATLRRNRTVRTV